MLAVTLKKGVCCGQLCCFARGASCGVFSTSVLSKWAVWWECPLWAVLSEVRLVSGFFGCRLMEVLSKRSGLRFAMERAWWRSWRSVLGERSTWWTGHDGAFLAGVPCGHFLAMVILAERAWCKLIDENVPCGTLFDGACLCRYCLWRRTRQW